MTLAAKPSLLDASHASSLVPVRALRWWVVPVGYLAAALCLLAYVIFLSQRFAPGIIMPDDTGYFSQASLIARHFTTWFRPESDAQFIGMHWLLTPEGTYVSRYPAGLSVMVGVLYAVFGWKAGVLTNSILAVAAVVGTFAATKRLTRDTGGASFLWGITAGAVLAFNPTFTSHALAGDAHTGVACFLAWAIYFLFRWADQPSRVSAVLAGVCIGVIPTIRYPDVVMYLGLGVFVMYTLVRFHWVDRRPCWADIAWMAGAALIAMSPQLIRNQLVLGAFWRTGYSLTNEQTGFGLDHFRQHFWMYLQATPTTGIGLFWATGFLGIAAMLGFARTRPVALLLAGTILPMILLYMAYYWGGMGGNGAGVMRFMVPTFVAFAIAGAWALSQIGKNAPASARLVIAVVVLAMQGLWAYPNSIGEDSRQQTQRQNLAAVTEALEQNIPQGAVVIADNGLHQHLDYVRQWKLADISMIRGGGGGPMGGARFGTRDASQPSPMQQVKAQERAKLYPGTVEDRTQKFAKDTQTWADGKGVYFVGAEQDARQLGKVGENGTLKIIARIPLQAQQAEPASSQRGGMGGGGFGMGGGPGMGGGGPGGFGPPDGGPGGGGPGGGFGGGFGMGGGGFGGRRGGGGGLIGGSFNGAKEVVIAQWTP